MKFYKAFLMMILILILCLSCAIAEGVPVTYRLGDQIEDFTVTTYDSRTLTLSEVLKEKEMVLINIWASWCGPCRMEFPYMEEAYQQYSDKVEIVALSCEPTDTDEVLADFVNELGMTFPVARDTLNFAYKFSASSIPTSIVVDRYGVICWIQAGMQPSTEHFAQLFDVFLGEDYAEPVIFSGTPPQRADEPHSPEAEIAAALDSDGLIFANPVHGFTWPMVTGEKDGRSVVMSTNQGRNGFKAELVTTVRANAGDALLLEFKTSTEAACDLLTVSVGGEVIKTFGGEKAWMTYAIPFESSGEQIVRIAYSKDSVSSAGEDMVWIDRIQLLSGAAAAEALAKNPVYPTAEHTDMSIVSPGAREILLTDPYGLLQRNFGDAKYYMIPDTEAEFSVVLEEKYDPERTIVYCDYDRSIRSLANMLTDEGYVFYGGVDTPETTGYEYTGMHLFPNGSETERKTIIYFSGEENVNAFITNRIPTSAWSYAEEPALPMKGLDEEEPGMSTYRLQVVDQQGNAVPGAMVQVCDDSVCQVLVTDISGVAQAELLAKEYEIHLLMLPEGYTGDLSTVSMASSDGCDMTFQVNKE